MNKIAFGSMAQQIALLQALDYTLAISFWILEDILEAPLYGSR